MKLVEIFSEFKINIDEKVFISYVHDIVTQIWKEDFDVVNTQLFNFNLKNFQEMSQTIKTSIVACYGLTVTESGNRYKIYIIILLI